MLLENRNHNKHIWDDLILKFSVKRTSAFSNFSTYLSCAHSLQVIHCTNDSYVLVNHFNFLGIRSLKLGCGAVSINPEYSYNSGLTSIGLPFQY